MADPFAIIQSGMLDIGKINSDYNLNRYRGLQAKVFARQAAQEDAAAARQAAAREAIGRGAKPDEVMAQDLDMGAKYAEYVQNNGDQAHETAQRQAGAIVQIGTALKSVPRGPQRQGIWARALPVLKSVGVTDADLANFDPNDDNAIDAQVISHKALLKAGEDYTLGRTRFSGATNAPLASVPEDDKWVPVPAGGFLQRIPGSGSQPMDERPYQSPLDAPGETLKGAGGDFHSIVAAEGGTNPDGSFRTSPKGAIGPAQLMPGTIPEAAQLAGVDPKLVYTDPAANLAAGKAYHDKQLRDFGDPALAAAAYNAGPGRVREALAQGGPQGWMQHVPAETRAYVPKVMGGAQGGAPANTPDRIYGAPKPSYHMLSTQEAQAQGLDPAAKWQVSPDGQISAIAGQNKPQLKAWPQKALADFHDNLTSVALIDKAIALIDPANKSPEAEAARYSIGPTNNVMPNWLLQQTDEKGNDFRSLIGRIGGVLIKDISGAAVTAAEDQRLARWIPLPTDTPSAALSKLKNLRESVQQSTGQFNLIYNEDNGYRPFKGGGGQGEHDSRPPQSGGQQSGGAAIPPGAVYVGTHQGRPVYKVNGRNWTP